MGLPISVVASVASRDFCSRSARATACRRAARSPNELERQARCASCACCSAASTCWSVNSWKVWRTSSVVGLTESRAIPLKIDLKINSYCVTLRNRASLARPSSQNFSGSRLSGVPWGNHRRTEVPGMRLVGRRGLVALGFLLALAPLSAAKAEDGNQAAIDAAKAEKAWLISLPAMDQGVALGQLEIANARAIAKMLSYDAHAQSEIPNSMQQYNAFCATAIQHMQAKLSNAAAMVAAKPWD